MFLKLTPEQDGRRKLKKSDEEKILHLYKTGEYTYMELGELFGVSHNRIGQIIRGDDAKNLERIKRANYYNKERLTAVHKRCRDKKRSLGLYIGKKPSRLG